MFSDKQDHSRNSTYNIELLLNISSIKKFNIYYDFKDLDKLQQLGWFLKSANTKCRLENTLFIFLKKLC